MVATCTLEKDFIWFGSAFEDEILATEKTCPSKDPFKQHISKICAQYSFKVL